MRSRLIVLAIAALSMSWATSCSLTSLDVSAHPVSTARALPPLDPHSVTILANPPARYEVVGTIRVGWFGIRSDEEILTDVEIQNALRQQAARMGADGVISIVLLRRPGSFGRTPEVFSNYLVATAIRSGVRTVRRV